MHPVVFVQRCVALRCVATVMHADLRAMSLSTDVQLTSVDILIVACQ